MWDKAIPAEQRINDIEQGDKPSIIETLRDPVQIQQVIIDLVKSANEEVLAIFSSANTFYLQNQLGIIKLLEDVVNRDIPVKLLTPSNKKSDNQKVNIDNAGNRPNLEDNTDIDLTMKKVFSTNMKKDGHYFIDSKNKLRRQWQEKKKLVDIRFMEYDLQTKVSILIVDKGFA